jgi:hypothetical protein
VPIGRRAAVDEPASEMPVADLKTSRDQAAMTSADAADPIP